MATRSENLDLIARFLRERYTYTEKVLSSLSTMTTDQRDAIVTNENFTQDTKTHYTFTELADAMANVGMYYDKVRYILIGPDMAVFRKQGQPNALSKKGIVIDYSESKTRPTFYYDKEMLIANLKNRAPIVVPAKEEVKPEPSSDKNEAPAAPVGTVVMEACNLKHIPRWALTLIRRATNNDDVRLDDLRQMLIDGKPVVAIKYLTTDMIEDDVPDDWTAVVFDNDDLVINEESTE